MSEQPGHVQQEEAKAQAQRNQQVQQAVAVRALAARPRPQPVLVPRLRAPTPTPSPLAPPQEKTVMPQTTPLPTQPRKEAPAVYGQQPPPLPSGAYASPPIGYNTYYKVQIGGSEGKALVPGQSYTVYFTSIEQAQAFANSLNARPQLPTPSVTPGAGFLKPSLRPPPNLPSSPSPIVTAVQNYFAQSTMGYANLAKSTQEQANKQTNPYARFGESFLAGLEYEGAGFTDVFATSVGKPVSIPVNPATTVGAGLGIAAETVVLGGTATALKIGSVASVAKGAAFGATLGAGFSEVQTGGKASAEQVFQSTIAGATIGAEGSFVAGGAAKLISLQFPSAGAALQSKGLTGVTSRAAFGGSINVGLTLPSSQNPQTLAENFVIGAGLSPALEVGGKYFDLGLAKSGYEQTVKIPQLPANTTFEDFTKITPLKSGNFELTTNAGKVIEVPSIAETSRVGIQSEGYSYEGIVGKAFGKNFVLGGVGTTPEGKFVSIGTPEFAIPDLFAKNVGEHEQIETEQEAIRTPLDRLIQLKSLSNAPAIEQIYFKEGIEITSGLRGTKTVKPTQFDFVKLQGLSDIENQTIISNIKGVSDKLELAYGSFTVEPQTGQPFRLAHDVDLQFNLSSEDAKAIAENFANNLNEVSGSTQYKVEGLNVVNESGTIVNIHSQEDFFENTYAKIKNAGRLGYPDIGSVKVEKIPVQKVGQTLTNKAATSLMPRYVQGEFEFSPTTRRAKDLPDFINIAKALDFLKGGKFAVDIESFQKAAIQKGLVTSEELTQPTEMKIPIFENVSSEEQSVSFKTSLSSTFVPTSSIKSSPIINSFLSTFSSVSSSSTSTADSLFNSISARSLISRPSTSIGSLFAPSRPSKSSSAFIPSSSPIISPRPSRSPSPSNPKPSSKPSSSLSRGISPSQARSIEELYYPSTSPSKSKSKKSPPYFPPSKPPRYPPPSTSPFSAASSSLNRIVEFDVFKAVQGGIEEFRITGRLKDVFPALPNKPKTTKVTDEYFRALVGVKGGAIGGFKAIKIKPVNFFPTKRKK